MIFGPLFFDNSPDPCVDLAISRTFNDWSAEIFNQSVHKDRFAVSAALAVADIPAAVAEVERAAGLGFAALISRRNSPTSPTRASKGADGPVPWIRVAIAARMSRAVPVRAVNTARGYCDIKNGTGLQTSAASRLRPA